jgi:dynein heavy chain
MHSEEVKKELPEESKNFIGIDSSVKEILATGNATKNVLKFCLTENLMQRLEQTQSDLDLCEKALMNFLGTKKNAFPRFFFLSVDDLLDILSNGDKPQKINKAGHITKIFQAIEYFKMKENGDDKMPDITGIVACTGKETFDFR